LTFPILPLDDIGDSSRVLVIHRYQPHPIANLVPEMAAGQLAALTANIVKDGLLDDLVLFQGKILDGRARYAACIAAGAAPGFREFDPAAEGDPTNFVVNKNLVRKQFWEKSQRAMIAAGLVQATLGSNQHSEGVTIGTACRLLGISRQSVNRAKKFRLESPTAAAAILRGRMSIGSGDTLTKLPPEIQAAILAESTSGSKLKKRINEALREWRTANPVTMPEGRFKVILSDPPWPGDDLPYLMDRFDQIDRDHRSWLPQKAADDCFLFLWTTQANLPFAMQMIKGWGWNYSFTMVWKKGHGHKHPQRPMYDCEFVIVATKGSPQFVDTRGLRTCFQGERRTHSEKPDEFYEMIKRATAGPRLELHTRRPHDGFEAHGYEMELFKPSESAVPIREIRISKKSLLPFRSSSIDIPHFENWLSDAFTAAEGRL
jgi:N6-adenosine-specific RNA methylase IME4